MNCYALCVCVCKCVCVCVCVCHICVHVFVCVASKDSHFASAARLIFVLEENILEITLGFLLHFLLTINCQEDLSVVHDCRTHGVLVDNSHKKQAV
jgi:hypothetical protein